MLNNYFDINHYLRPYTYSLPAIPGTVAPVNALRGEDTPTSPTGFWPGENSGAWADIEDHRGESGYVNGAPFTITDFGPYPQGWTTEPPEPTPEENVEKFNQEINARLQAFAQEHDWDTIDNALVQSGTFINDAKTAQAAYDLIWNTAIALTPQILDGSLSLEDAINQLPVLIWDDDATIYFREYSDVLSEYTRPWSINRETADSDAGKLVAMQMTLASAQSEIPVDSTKVAGLNEAYQALIIEMADKIDEVNQRHGIV